MIVGPAVAEDVQILGQYLTSQKRAPPSRTRNYNLVSNAPGSPILYLSVPKRREGLRFWKSATNDFGTDSWVVQGWSFQPVRFPLLWNTAHPICGPIRYFDHLRPSFPILDEQTFPDLRQRHDETISSAFLREFCALALPLWNRSDQLRGHLCPDIRYTWNLAMAALNDDFIRAWSNRFVYVVTMWSLELRSYL